MRPANSTANSSIVGANFSQSSDLSCQNSTRVGWKLSTTSCSKLASVTLTVCSGATGLAARRDRDDSRLQAEKALNRTSPRQRHVFFIRNFPSNFSANQLLALASHGTVVKCSG